MLKKIRAQILARRQKTLRGKKIKRFIKEGSIPWSEGYAEYRADKIKEAIQTLPIKFINWGLGIDERIVEIPWIFKNLSFINEKILDAGSSLNHDYILDLKLIKTKELTICTYHPESYARPSQRINYVYADLRELPFKDSWFDTIVCISTLEHIDMDNSMYGYTTGHALDSREKSYSYLKAVHEMIRVLRLGGQLLITVPFGEFENHGFFQQFDKEMLSRMIGTLSKNGEMKTDFFRYSKSGWNSSTIEDCSNEQSFNPHTGIGKKDDGAAHCRSVACLNFTKLK
ncbi:MAG: class I SAM-dependent methyltransferase [Bacteroidetes bacterium]|nr:class I SAM-dependent methyltransferase [Bacteroidota bacterium]